MTSRMVDGTSIDERPQIASSRLEVGHWEGDTVVGKRNGREAVILTLLEKKTQQTKQEQKKTVTKTQILVALVCCVVDFGIAQFGLLTLIQKAYSILAYLAIPVILIPYIVHMVVTRMDTRNERITKEKCR